MIQNGEWAAPQGGRWFLFPWSRSHTEPNTDESNRLEVSWSIDSECLSLRWRTCKRLTATGRNDFVLNPFNPSSQTDLHSNDYVCPFYKGQRYLSWIKIFASVEFTGGESSFSNSHAHGSTLSHSCLYVLTRGRRDVFLIQSLSQAGF